MLKKVILLFAVFLLITAGCRSIIPGSMNLVLDAIYSQEAESYLKNQQTELKSVKKVSNANPVSAVVPKNDLQTKRDANESTLGDKQPKPSVSEQEKPSIQKDEAAEKVLDKQIPQENNYAGEKNIYLTFDDGPDVENTPRILAILEQYSIKATFFVVGTNVEKFPELVKKIDQQGSVVANHTYSHRYQSVYASEEGFLQEIYKNEELVYQLIGKRPVVIREPGGRFLGKPEKQEFVVKAGYQLKGWNVDSYDSRKPIPTANQIVANVKKQGNNSRLWSEMVILFHDGPGHASTVEALPQIIEYFQAQGFNFKVWEK